MSKHLTKTGGITMTRTQKRAALVAVLAAGLYALSSPLSKLLLKDVSPKMMAALLYLGAGCGMLALQDYRIKQDNVSKFIGFCSCNKHTLDASFIKCSDIDV